MAGEFIAVVVPGVPVAKGRPKFSTFGGRPRAITPAKTRHYEDALRFEAARVMGSRPPLDCALSVMVSAYLPIPVSFSKVKRDAALLGTLRPTKRPDCDNISKTVDALNQIVWRDDAQIVHLTVRKLYSDKPRLEVVISEFQA